VTAPIGATVHRIVGGSVLIDGALHRTDLLIDRGRIAAVESAGTADTDAGHVPTPGPGTPDEAASGATVFDATGSIVAAGFIDLQCNGAGGTDLTAEVADDDGAVERVARVLPRYGVTAFLPTVVTAPRRVRDAAIAALCEHDEPTRRDAVGATPLGLHFEGPLLSPGHLGAHDGAHITAPTSDEIAAWIDSNVVSLVTVAPEVDGAVDVIRQLAAAGIAVSAGHTAMSPAAFASARDAGLSYVTHLYNAMAPFNHRRPGPIGAVLADDRVTAGLICDGLHADPAAIRMAWRALGPHRTSLVSDAAAPLGGPFGRFHLGTLEVVYDETGVRTVDGVLAGSALELDRAVRNLVEFAGCSLTEAIATVTSTPADLLGLVDRGRVAVGNHADLTIVDHEGRLEATIIGGRVGWRS